MRVLAVRRTDKIIVIARQRFARHLIAAQRCDECFRNVGHNDLGVVQCGLRQPVRVHAHAERQPRIRRRDFERLRQRFGIVCADQHSRNANALQHTDSRPHIRAVRQMAFIVLHMKLRNYRSAAQIAQSQHSGTQRRKRRRTMQIIERRIIVQQRTEDLLALLNVVHGDRAFAVLRIGFWRTRERQADRQRRQLFSPCIAQFGIRCKRACKLLGRGMIQRNCRRIVQQKLRFMLGLT